MQIGRSLVTLPDCCGSDLASTTPAAPTSFPVPNLMPDLATRGRSTPFSRCTWTPAAACCSDSLFERCSRRLVQESGRRREREPRFNSRAAPDLILQARSDRDWADTWAKDWPQTLVFRADGSISLIGTTSWVGGTRARIWGSKASPQRRRPQRWSSSTATTPWMATARHHRERLSMSNSNNRRRSTKSAATFGWRVVSARRRVAPHSSLCKHRGCRGRGGIATAGPRSSRRAILLRSASMAGHLLHAAGFGLGNTQRPLAIPPGCGRHVAAGPRALTTMLAKPVRRRVRRHRGYRASTGSTRHHRALLLRTPCSDLSQHQYAGPDSALAAVILAVVLPLSAGDPHARSRWAARTAIVSGIVCVAAGVASTPGSSPSCCRSPYATVYMNGIALTVMLSQIPKLLGFKVSAEGPIRQAWGIVEQVIAGRDEPRGVRGRRRHARVDSS